MPPIVAILLLGPSLNGAGRQPQHLSSRFQSGALENGLIDQLQRLLPL
jgi:hypothetical protein